MSGFQGTGTTYKFQTGVPLDFREFIDRLDPIELAAQNMYGSDGLGVLSKDTSSQIRFDWQSEQLLLPASKLAVALGGLNTDTTVTVRRTADGENYDHKLKFQTGSVLKIGDERILVTGYAAGAGELTVERGFAGSAITAHAVGDLVREVGHALPEGSKPQERRATDRDSSWNVHQIFGPVGVSVSRSRQAVERFGVPRGAELPRQTRNRLIELAHSVENAIFYGLRYDDDVEERRTMGGLFYYAAQNVNASAVDLAAGPQPILNLLLDMYNAGQRGRRLRMFINPVQGPKIDTWDEGSIRLGRQDNGRGQIVTYLDTRFGRVDFVMSDHVEPTDAIIVDREQVVIKTLPGRDYQFVPEGITGDSWEGFAVCEKSVEFVRPEHAGVFNNLTV